MPLQPHDTERQNSDVLNGILSWAIGLGLMVTLGHACLETATAVPHARRTALERCSEHALRRGGAGDELVNVERQLSENLQSVRTMETLQKTVQHLNAAVNLLVAPGAKNRAV